MKFISKKHLKSGIIIVITIILVKLIMVNPPKNHRGRPAQVAKMAVQIKNLAPQNYQIKIASFGTVKPRTQSALVAQVSGQITSISDHFREGGFFEKGEILVTIDARDYQAELKIAQAEILKAQQNLFEEKARVSQAKQDWQRLGNGEKASILVLRKPQLAAAEAQVLSAQAKFDKAQLSLERTNIVAPYSGRILTKQVDIGQVVSMNSKLAEVFATDSVEIRLPIHNSDLRFINLPEQYSQAHLNREKLNEDQVAVRRESKVAFRSDLAPNQRWQGKLVRTEGSIDSNAQQLYVVAKIADPFKRRTKSVNNSEISIKIGQYLEAKISGKLLKQVLVIPNTSIYQGSYVYIVEKGVLKRQEIEISWQNDKNALIASGLTFGQQLVTTSLGQVSSGTAVKILSEQATKKRARNKKISNKISTLKNNQKSGKQL